jgi:hypothetical protein
VFGMTDPFQRATVAMFRQGVAATYTPAGGGEPIDCVVIPGRGESESGQYGAVMEPVTRMSLQHDEVGEPKRGDLITISTGRWAGSWKVDRLESSDGYQATVIVT